MKKKFLSLGTAFLIALSIGTQPLNVSASEMDSGLQYEENDFEKAGGLISKYYLSIAGVDGKVAITAQTKSNSVMAVIGFKNISVQRSPNGYSSWTEETTVPDQLKYNSTSKTLSDYLVNVSGGCYYRVQLDHYADNGSGSTQSVPNTSNVIWIS